MVNKVLQHVVLLFTELDIYYKIPAVKFEFYLSIVYFSRVVDYPMDEQGNATAVSTITLWAKNAFDNDATPFFALAICLWGKLRTKKTAEKKSIPI